MASKQNLKKILFVDDESDFQMMFVEQIGGRAKVVCVGTEDDAFRAYQVFKPFDLIVLDGMLRNANTLAFSRHVREDGYAGPMLACSSSRDFRREQMKHGCDHECETKVHAGRQALEILGLS